MTAIGTTWLIARWEFTTAVMRVGFLAALLGMPLAHLGIGALIAFATREATRDTVPDRPVIVVDRHGVLGTSDGRDVVMFDESAAIQGLREGRVEAVYVLGEDFLSTGRVRAFARPSPGFLAFGRRIEHRGRAATVIRRGLVTDSLPAGRGKRLVEPIVEVSHYQVESSRIAAAPEDGPAFLAGPFGVCFVLGLAIFLVSGTLQQAMSAELRNRMLEVMLSLVSPLQLLAGKTLGLAAAGLIQVTVYLALTVGFGAAISLGDLPLSVLLWSAAIFLVGYVLFTVLLAGLGALARDAHESTEIASICLLGAAVPFFFITHISTEPTSSLSRAVSWFPPTAPVALLLRLGVDGVGTLERSAVMAGVLVFAGACLWLAARLFAARVRSSGRLRLT